MPLPAAAAFRFVVGFCLVVLAGCSDTSSETSTASPSNRSASSASSAPSPAPLPPPVPPVPPPEPVRGLVVISVDTLRAGHLGAYGHVHETSPRLDELAARGVVFDLAFAHSPSTLISHMSLFTSLLPPEHGVKPPQWNVLSSEIPTLPEVFRDAGFRTAGFTEGGYMEGDHGFARGFETWRDPGFEHSTDVEETFRRGLDFLRSSAVDEPFFLFLHTYSVHDPYAPPPADRHRFWEEDPPTTLPADAETLGRVNEGLLDFGDEEAAYYASRYDDGIRYFDAVLGRFLDELAGLDLADEIALVLLSDHGEEFLDHGRMLHTQVYPELLRVPLLVVHPDLPHRRVRRPVGLVDLAPTLFELAGLDSASLWSHLEGRGTSTSAGTFGRSLLPELTGTAPPEGASPVSPGPNYGEVSFIDAQRSLVAEIEGEAWQLVERAPLPDADGAWIRRSVETDVEMPEGTARRRLGLRLAAFHRPRELTVERRGAAGWEVIERRTLPPEWTDVALRLEATGGTRRTKLRLSVDGCDVPRSLGMGDDPRCLGFMVASPTLRSRELLRLRVDGGGRLWASDDLSLDAAYQDVFQRLSRRLDELSLRPVGAAGHRDLSPEERLALEALGYL